MEAFYPRSVGFTHAVPSTVGTSVVNPVDKRARLP